MQIDDRLLKKSPMKYSFRRGALTGDERIEVAETSVQLFRKKDKAIREIAFANISKIHSFSNMSAWDEDGGQFETHITQLTPRRGRGITLCSSSYIRMGTGQRQIAKNNADGYIRAIDEIKRRVVEENPQAMLVTGNIVASVMGYICSLVGLGLMGLLAWVGFFGPKPLQEIWPLLLSGVFIGVIFIPFGLTLGKAYAPVRRLLADTVNEESES